MTVAPIHPDEVAATIDEFAALGWHRTGSPGDVATARWLQKRLRGAGLPARLHTFGFPHLRVRTAHVSGEGFRIGGTPAYDTPPLPAGRLDADLSRPDAMHSGDIVLLDGAPAFDPQSHPAAGRAAALIVMSGDPEGEVMLRNAERIGQPQGVPVLQVARRDAAPLLEAARRRARVRLDLDHRLEDGTAHDVVAELGAPEATGPVVLMTPISGWFHCAAERGGGIAIALALAARAATMTGRRRSLRLLFTSGHELGHWGMKSLLGAHPQWRAQTSLWIHLGASIGARHPDGARLFVRGNAWRASFPSVLERHGAGPFSLVSPDTLPGGEAREVFDHPFVSMAGHHRYFHSPQDLPATAVDAARVARFGAAFAELLQAALTAGSPTRA